MQNTRYDLKGEQYSEEVGMIWNGTFGTIILSTCRHFSFAWQVEAILRPFPRFFFFALVRVEQLESFVC